MSLGIANMHWDGKWVGIKKYPLLWFPAISRRSGQDVYLPLSICATKAHVYEMNWLWSSLGNHFSGNNNVIILTGGRNPRIYEMNGVFFTSLSEDSRLLFRKWQQANVPSTVVAVQTEPKSSEKDGNRLSAWYLARRRKLLKNGTNYHNNSAFISADKFFFPPFFLISARKLASCGCLHSACIYEQRSKHRLYTPMYVRRHVSYYLSDISFD